MMKNNIKYLAILALGIVACEPEFDNPVEESDVYVSGEADFSNYVALGNSLTAGYADASLYITGQENSYPNILAQQFEFAGGGEFKQPLMADNTGGLLLGGTQIQPNRLVLAFDAEGNPGPAVYTGGQASTDVSTTLTGPFNNLGAPGAKSFHLVAEGYGNVAGVAAGLANPYYARFASSANASIIGDAVSQNPTFFSLWIGNNDILGYATSGGVGVDHNETGNLDPTTYGSNDITNTNVFGSVYSQLVAGLTANGAEGVVLNIPDVKSIPFFTFRPTLDATQVAGLTGFYKLVAGIMTQQIAMSGVPLEQAAQIASQYEFTFEVDKPNARIIQVAPTPTNPLGLIRQTDELILLTSTESGFATIDAEITAILERAAMDILPTPEEGAQIIDAIDAVSLDENYLDDEEQTKIAMAQASFNATIKAIADANDLAFYDANAALSQIANGGIAYDGGVITSQFISGGAFSLDGVHPSPRAHAILANGILDVLKEKYNTNLPRVKAGTYGTVTLSNDVN
ncbi:G-D-S-L family lipolytic protein [Aquimarina sp. 2-A2]|uniref:G-D-S-L family lipolytic protein n=1 Tax=Aquimarina sp. 2-A2 TaxID=3382644 RepID=UPI00387F2B08